MCSRFHEINNKWAIMKNKIRFDANERIFSSENTMIIIYLGRLI